ncbi:MAG: tetratricopeptide repeat protein [Deltaproteobacteria bacterium]|nr:tetratricopeptide repeat protein [Deltaproteobacteria bacterium]
MAIPPPLPHRVTFLAPVMTLPAGADHLEQPAALLLYITVFEHFLRHPSVSMTDPDDHRLVDGDDRLITINHPEIGDIRDAEYGSGRRDELIWFELSLDPSRPAPVRLKAERYDGRSREFVAVGQAPVGAQIANCIVQWLSSMGHPQAPRPIEPFTAEEFLNATLCGYEAIRNRTPDGGVNLTIPARLKVPFFRFVYVTLNLYTWREILQLEPDNAWAIRDQFLDGLHNDGPTTRDPIRAAIRTSPMFGKLYLSMFGDGVSDEEKLHAFAMATVLIPANSYALKDYGYTLDSFARWPEASRWAERACGNTPTFIYAHQLAFDVYDLCRYGALLETAQHHMGFLQHLVQREVLEPGDPDLRHCHLRYADTLMRTGRLDEAIELRTQGLRGVEGSWPNQMKVLDKWRTDPSMFATLYSREASLRGDPGRVLEGFSAAPPDGAAELGMMIDALIALGKEDLGAIAYSHYSRTNYVVNPVARLAGARALALTGSTASAIDALQRVSLSFCHTGWDTAVNRVLRLLATRPPAEWEAVVQSHLACGARRLAKLVARDAADFVPGIAPNSPIVQALAGQQPFGFDPSFFAALRASVEPHGISDCDQLFAQLSQPTLEHADRLANEWPKLVPAEPVDGAPEPVAVARAAKILWGFASAFGRYLALTTQPPNVLAGGYRQVASDALELLRSARGVLPRIVIRQLLEGIERMAGAVDPWLLDFWMLRFERALDLEANEGGHLEPLVAGLQWMSWLLRGDERVGYEYKVGTEALADPARAGDALGLLERSVRAVGRGAAPKWSQAASACLPPDQAIDVHMTAAFMHPGFAGPAVAAAKILIPHGLGQAAFDVLCSNLPGAGKQWREQRVAELAPLWNQARMPCPIDWNQCFQAGMAAFQQGNFQLAIDAHRWCLAIDPDNGQAWKNLGMAYARAGREHESIAAFARADRNEAPKWAGQALREAKHYDKSILVYRYASLRFNAWDDWLALAGSAAMAENPEVAAEAYGRALALNPQGATLNMLHQLADALGETGEYAKCGEIAQRLLGMAKGDATYTTCANYHMATALLGLRRFQEAAQYAEVALAQNQYPENQAPYAEKLDRARRGDPPAPKPTRAASVEGRMWNALADGDFKGLSSFQAGNAWKQRRAVLSAVEFRFESENDVTVTPRAREAALAALAETVGQTDPHAAHCRLQALRIRENDVFPVDVPCKMGARVPREQFRQLFAQRSGQGMAAQAPAAGEPDPVVFPGQRIARLSDYVRVVKGMQTGNVAGALQAAGLDMNAWGQVAAAWGQRLSQDQGLAQQFQMMMR